MWQPISTAPRDGTPFFAGLWVEHSRNGVKVSTTWESFYVWCDDETGEFHRDCDPGWGIEDFSHWVPAQKLPPAPERAPAAVSVDTIPAQ